MSQNPITAAANHIQNGKLVIFPTETVYGLGADATNGKAVATIFDAKGRPRFNPLIAHILSAENGKTFGVFNAEARHLAKSFWPGPLTLVVPKKQNCAISSLACAGLETVALRAPRHPIARALIKAAERPIAAPSANKSGRISPTSAAMAAESLKDAPIAMVLDGGASECGLESTILACIGETPCLLLREGAIPQEAIAEILGFAPKTRSAGTINAPGQLLAHYAPRAPLRLNAREIRQGEVLLAFGEPIAGAETERNLSPKSDLREAAANLFAMLDELDRLAGAGIAVMPIPETGLGRAINDRLRRGSREGA